METTKPALERAFELARSGNCFHVDEIIKQLKSERLNSDQVVGPTLKKQLQQVIGTRHSPSEP